MRRKPFLEKLFQLATSAFLVYRPHSAAAAFSMQGQHQQYQQQQQQQQQQRQQTALFSTETERTADAAITTIKTTVAYQPFSLYMEDLDVQVPVATWFPLDPATVGTKQEQSAFTPATYRHRISVRRIGQMLAKWDFIPEFFSRDFELTPESTSPSTVVEMSNNKNDNNINFPMNGPVVILAHGYLGSRFDLSHLAETLAQEGFTCVAPEYPESLAASYPRLFDYEQQVPLLTRRMINTKLLQVMKENWGISPTNNRKFGIIGHSLGCGTAFETGDTSWTRVCLAGGIPRFRLPASSNILFVSSKNDGAVSLSRFGGLSAIPPEYTILDESLLLETIVQQRAQQQQSPSYLFPNQSFLFLDRPDAPNHISFLSEQVNDAMIDLLSPLLPVARAFGIPVLDFDQYQVSRDSRATAQMLHPILVEYLKQIMM